MMRMEQGRPKFDRHIYVLKNVKNCTEIKEKAAKFICNNNVWNILDQRIIYNHTILIILGYIKNYKWNRK